ncbi:hypothetical protein [Pseudomarimonas arenosa]|uniref:Cyclophilin-like domain-containing protein n=1 Tax=Pseudomarimonas arenosa TaxID=2774145 RepID=A0AAW3ZSD2_9GAMM|nr:hypothetical protein [Pseudomarimonas arenosa]MBD8528334.1 hypothetical protein [Pseudomarimonas arenosa]
MSRVVLALVLLCPFAAGACIVDGTAEEILGRVFAQSRFVFLATVGPTERIPSEDDRFESVLASDLTVVESFKGALKPGERVPMRLGQPKETNAHFPAFAWLGDRVLIYAPSIPVTEESFNIQCGMASHVIGNYDDPNDDIEYLEILRRLKNPETEG